MDNVQNSIPRYESMASRPLLSVMIPTYNGSRYLRETLESVLNQAWSEDAMQIEVVDDASPDSGEILQLVTEIGQGRISYFQQPTNQGLSGNWNTCIERSRGYWVHILHQDDLVYPGFYSRMEKGFEEPDVGAVFCCHEYIGKDGERLAVTDQELTEAGILPVTWLDRIAVMQVIQTPSIVVRRVVYEELGGFRDDLVYALDWEMWKRIAVYFRFWYEPEVLAAYRMFAESETGRLAKSATHIRDARKSLAISKSYLPPDHAEILTNQAREVVAIFALREARRQVESGNLRCALAQIREALITYRSKRVLSEVVGILRSGLSAN